MLEGLKWYATGLSSLRFIGKGGRINLPARHRKLLGLVEREEVVVGVENGAMRIETRDAAIDREQRKVRERFGYEPDWRLSEELIAERREEALREEAVGEVGPPDQRDSG